MAKKKKWQEYQDDCAAFFEKLGLATFVDHPVQGARGLHRADVFVEGAYHGIPFKWIVECKAWKTNVPKEKVMALASIVQDTGVDRGFLLSEKGFQSGAIQAAKKTNTTLTSLGDLVDSTEEQLSEAIIQRLYFRLQKARHRLRDIKRERYAGQYYPPTTIEMGRLFVLESAFGDALKGDYPIVYSFEGDTRPEAKNLREFLDAAERIIANAENWSVPATDSSAE